MDKFVIKGGRKLMGEVDISGAKNAVLPIMAACILKPATYTIRNVPNLRDTRTMIKLLEESGAIVKFNKNKLVVDSRNCNNPVAPYELVKTMRASFYMLGPFISRFGKSTVSLPGGCAWGPRPVDFHIKALKKMGAKVELKDGNIQCSGKLKGCNINFKKKSVGATGNIIMAAVGAEGQTTISNASCEPEIEDLCNFISLLGVDIKGIGTDELKINSSKDSVISKVEYSIIPDRIEAATFMILGNHTVHVNYSIDITLFFENTHHENKMNNGCDFDSLIQINEPDEVQINLETNNISCNGLNDGLAEITPFGCDSCDIIWSNSITNTNINNNLPVASLLALRGRSRMASRNLSCRLVQLGVKPGLSLEPCFAQVRLRSARMTNARWDWHRFPHSAVDIVSAMDFCRLVLRHARQR